MKYVDDPQIKLNYLIENCTGEAKDAIEDCVIMPPNEGYFKALEILKKRYGRPHDIARMYIRDLVNGPAIESSDLSKLSLMMNRCSMTLNQIGYQADLNNSENLLQIVRRLPMHLQTKWAEKADIIIEDGVEPQFDDLAAFVERHARVASTMYGQDLIATRRASNHSPAQSHPPAPQKTNGAVYALQGATNKGQWKVECGYCGQGHQMWLCDDFRRLTYDDRRTEMRRRRLCDNCFSKGHISRDCPKRNFCSVEDCRVRYKHSTVLHPEPKPRNCDQPAQASQPNAERPSTTDTSQGGETHRSYATSTSNRNGVCMNIVPVKVKNGSAIVETYALLDSCSDVTLCSESLAQKLKVTGEKRPLTLTTLNAELERKATVVAMDISPLSEETSVHLDEVWAIDDLRISADRIATQEDANSWPHLCGLLLPKSSATKVELLIGGDVPEAFWTGDVRRGGKQQPYAMETIFGWSIIGPAKRREQQATFFPQREPTPKEGKGREWRKNDDKKLPTRASAPTERSLDTRSRTFTTPKTLPKRHPVPRLSRSEPNRDWSKRTDCDTRRQQPRHRQRTNLCSNNGTTSECPSRYRSPTASDRSRGVGYRWLTTSDGHTHGKQKRHDMNRQNPNNR